MGDMISQFVNQLCKSKEKRTKEECIEKYNQINLSHFPSHTKPETCDSLTGDVLNSSLVSTQKRKELEIKPFLVPDKNISNWSEEQNNQLEEALKKYPVSIDTNKRWSYISKCVSGKGKR